MYGPIDAEGDYGLNSAAAQTRNYRRQWEQQRWQKKKRADNTWANEPIVQLIVPGADMQNNPLIPLNGQYMRLEEADDTGEVAYQVDFARNAYIVQYLNRNQPR